MTKSVRIENADTNVSVGLKVEIYYWDAANHEWKLDYVKNLPYPTQLADITLHNERHIRISEYKIEHE